MPGFGDILKKAVYLGVGLASYAGEKAGATLTELRSQVQKLADDAVSRGEMTTEEARRFVEDMMKQAQQQPASEATVEEKKPPAEPRRIEILEEDEFPTAKVDSTKDDNVDELRKQVLDLQDELKRLQRDK
ncbi:MAG: phasin family protein [Heteroscytonema crispum UTEX LB 1556]